MAAPGLLQLEHVPPPGSHLGPHCLHAGICVFFPAMCSPLLMPSAPARQAVWAPLTRTLFPALILPSHQPLFLNALTCRLLSHATVSGTPLLSPKQATRLPAVWAPTEHTGTSPHWLAFPHGALGNSRHQASLEQAVESTCPVAGRMNVLVSLPFRPPVGAGAEGLDGVPPPLSS